MPILPIYNNQCYSLDLYSWSRVASHYNFTVYHEVFTTVKYFHTVWNCSTLILRTFYGRRWATTTDLPRDHMILCKSVVNLRWIWGSFPTTLFMSRFRIDRHDGIDLTNMYRLKNKSHTICIISLFFVILDRLIISLLFLGYFYRRIHLEFLDQNPYRDIFYRI